jgi:hypothetical protein
VQRGKNPGATRTLLELLLDRHVNPTFGRTTNQPALPARGTDGGLKLLQETLGL